MGSVTEDLKKFPSIKLTPLRHPENRIVTLDIKRSKTKNLGGENEIVKKF